MAGINSLDCIVIGYNEMPFEDYEALLRKYGESSVTYQDLKYSFVRLGDQPLSYVDLLNMAYRLAEKNGADPATAELLKSGDIPNLAAVYLVNFMRRRGLTATYINLYQYEKERLIRLLAENPLCVAITTTFYVLNLSLIEIVRFIREHNPTVKIVVGGPLVANHARRYSPDELLVALEEIGADIYVIESQGEDTLARIIQCLRSAEDLNRVPNIVYINGTKLQATIRIPENNSLDETYINWSNLADRHLGPTLQMRTARSCAFSCAFCAYPTRAGKLTLASIETIEKELDSMRKLEYVQNVVFIDDTFNVPLDRFKEICRLMIRKRYGFNWFSYFRCSNSDTEAIELMAESGCKGVFLGIESGSQSILKNMHKAATLEQYALGIDTLRRHSILTFASFIIGFPGETESTVDETVAFIRQTKPDYYRAQVWYCEPGTPIYEQREQYGITGSGFKWRHKTMTSLEAMQHIEKAFLSIDASLWLPQWSFDFWIIPYLLGKGVSLERFKTFMNLANQLLVLEFEQLTRYQKHSAQQPIIDNLMDWAGNEMRSIASGVEETNPKK